MHQPYVYKWTHLPTLKWYVGVTTGKKKTTTENSNIYLTVKCPHCNKEGSQPAMMRWHFNKCKETKLCS